MTKDKEVDDGILIETSLVGDTEEVVHVEISRIAAEKWSDNCGFTGADGGRG
jgi:hypothetical protein